MAFTLSLSVASVQQTRPDCSCPEGSIAATFDVGHHHTFIVCGYKDTTLIKGKLLFSELSLAVCGTKIPFSHWGLISYVKFR
ncbi:hypothetical protein ACUN24_20755 [Pedobacter sp. WC2501]|uniref:hypothetical protein n=1 Tax=Pedobacter sp. WC2501 TaxID=3461400 RepID=UPI004045B576